MGMVTAQSVPFHSLSHLHDDHYDNGDLDEQLEIDESERPTLPSITIPPLPPAHSSDMQRHADEDPPIHRLHRLQREGDALDRATLTSRVASEAVIRPRFEQSGSRRIAGKRSEQESANVFPLTTPDRAFFTKRMDCWEEGEHERVTPVVNPPMEAAMREWWLMQRRRDGLARWVIVAVALCTALTVAAFALPLI